MVSGFKKSNKKKGKLVLAKDPKQAKLAIIVLVIFVINTIYTAVKIYKENNPTVVSSSSQSEYNGDPTSPENTPVGGAIAPDGTVQDSTQPAQSPASPPASSDNISQDANDIYIKTIGMDDGGTASQGPDVDIMTKASKTKRYGKTVLISVDGSESSNPFLPSGDSEKSFKSVSLPYLTLPPETVSTNSDAGRVMTTTISGILYDKYSPSAIINIEGSDYLVKRGDVINHYKILFIGKAEVIVQLGKNIYKAGVGELLSPTDLNYNTIANLNKKFGGNNVQIKVKKKVNSRGS